MRYYEILHFDATLIYPSQSSRLLRVNVSKNQTNRGHDQKSISLILCQFEGLGKHVDAIRLVFLKYSI